MWSNEQTTYSTEPIDTRLPDSAKELPAGGFVAIRPPDANASSSAPQPLVEGITPELLTTIKDNTVMRAAENEAWLKMFEVLSSKTPDELQQLSIGQVSFAQLFQQTEFYRGQIVTVKGAIRRAEEIEPRQQANGIDQLFRWIVEPGGGSNAPIVVYSLEKPAAFVLGDDLREEGQFVGFCFKRWAYLAGDGSRIAPVILAKNVVWQPPTPETPVQIPSSSTATLIVAGLAMLATAIAVSVYRSSTSLRPEIARLRTSADLAVFDEQNVLPQVGESLQDLAESHRQDEP